MKISYFNFFSITLIFSLFGLMYKTYYQKIYQSKSLIEKNIVSESINENVRICAQVDTTSCSTNSDCNSGNCYQGTCHLCEVAGTQCIDDGNCCLSNCSNGYCAGENEVQAYGAAAITVGSSIGFGTAGVGMNVGLNVDRDEAVYSGDVESAVDSSQFQSDVTQAVDFEENSDNDSEEIEFGTYAFFTIF
ncbi:MAG: hypothetical protein ACXWL2_03470 [Candidatus Chromulinivorax sp.]